jgi:hypothetical protein
MNDFTKEELELLSDGLNYAVGNPYGFTADSIMPLYDKIQSMIDNYCDHDDRQYYEHVPVYECNKCHMVSMI